jgi:hypothetical protein
MNEDKLIIYCINCNKSLTTTISKRNEDMQKKGWNWKCDQTRKASPYCSKCLKN